MTHLLEITGLAIDLATGASKTHAVRGVDFCIAANECVGIAGESGCGKTTLMLAIAGLLPEWARVVEGEIRLNGTSLNALDMRSRRRLNGSEISCVFQNARNALHPTMTVGHQIVRARRRHTAEGRSVLRSFAHKSLSEVSLGDKILGRYPHELSGGQAQRVMIALALVGHPSLVLVDEPTSGLDPTAKLDVLKLLLTRTREIGASLVVVSHDLSVLAKACNRIAIMYAGEIVESGPCDEVLATPAHPYTRGLLASRRRGGRRMGFIAGAVPDLRLAIGACSFAARCPDVIEDCWRAHPAFRNVSSDHGARCIREVSSLRSWEAFACK